MSLDKAKTVSEIQGLKEQFQEFTDVPLRKGLTETQLKDEMNKFESMMNNLGNVNLRSLEIFDEVKNSDDNGLSILQKLKSENQKRGINIKEITGTSNEC